MANFTSFAGLEDAVIGTSINALGNEVLIYDYTRVINIFKHRGTDAMGATDWLNAALDRTDPEKQPVIAVLNDGMPDYLKGARGSLH